MNLNQPSPRNKHDSVNKLLRLQIQVSIYCIQVIISYEGCEDIQDFYLADNVLIGILSVYTVIVVARVVQLIHNHKKRTNKTYFESVARMHWVLILLAVVSIQKIGHLLSLRSTGRLESIRLTIYLDLVLFLTQNVMASLFANTFVTALSGLKLIENDPTGKKLNAQVVL
jgi:hypothetical protein